MSENHALTENERELLNILRGKTAFKNFTLTIAIENGEHRATIEDHDTGAQIGGRPERTLDNALSFLS